LRRYAEVTLEHEYDYFVVLSLADDTRVIPFTTPTYTTYSGTAYGSGTYGGGMATYTGQTRGAYTTTGGQTFMIHKPRLHLMIKCSKGEKPQAAVGAYDARVLLHYAVEPHAAESAAVSGPSAHDTVWNPETMRYEPVEPSAKR